MDGYLFFESLDSEQRETLLRLTESNELGLRIAATTVTGSFSAFAAYCVDEPDEAARVLTAVEQRVGMPARRLVALPPLRGLFPNRPPIYQLDKPKYFALVELVTAPGKEQALAQRADAAGASGVAVVIGGGPSVLVEVDAADEEQLAVMVDAIRGLGDLERVDVLLSSPALAAVNPAVRRSA